MSTIETGLSPAVRDEGRWSLEPYASDVLDELVAFHATTLVPGGRKFPTSAEGVADGIEGHVPGAAFVLREGGAVRGYTVLFAPSIAGQPGWHASVVLAADVDRDAARAALQSAVDGFHAHRPSDADAFLRIFGSRSHTAVRDAAEALGFEVERTFYGRRRPLSTADIEVPALTGFTALHWREVQERGLSEQARHVQYVAFLEHFGGLSKSPTAWRHHIDGPVFAPELSVAVVADGEKVDTVVGVLLASHYTDDGTGTREQNAHADYIAVLPAWRRRGVAELAIRHHAALAIAHGYPAVSLGVDQVNHGANRVYARLGYEITGESAAYRLDAPGR